MPGETFNGVFNDFFTSMGQTITIIRNYGSSTETTFELRALKNNKKGRPDDVMFQFPEQVDVRVDDIIKLKQGRDLWKVYDTEDRIIGEVYINFEAKVLKVNPNGIEITKNTKEHTIFNAPIYGGVQVGSGNIQNINLSIQSEVIDNVEKLISFISKSNIPTLEKEDAIEALKRIPELSQKEQTEEVINRVKSRLDIVKSALNIGKELAPIASPFLLSIAKAFGLG